MTKDKIKQAFRKVKHDIVTTRKSLGNALFGLSNEYAKFQLRIQELEKRVEELEAQNQEVEAKVSYAKSY